MPCFLHNSHPPKKGMVINMKVLLLKDVKGSGKSGQIVDVSDGYARNFLIPKGLAAAASAETINASRISQEAQAHRKAEQQKRAKELADSMSGLTVKVYAKAGDNGRLFGSITVKEIADALKAQYDIDVDKKKITLGEPIKSTGIIEASAHMYEKTDAKFKVEVLPLKAD